ncbi:tyrosine-type recombinase/integrase [Micromonospora sp. SL1-18]|uniref:tyrosine-type recombinase/integrase n=1 Tax=Micromonospora sp. SL1-18 TaxID=3399128 RepID=UPI003A4DFFB8
MALIAMLGLLGLRIFEACGTNIGDLGEEHGHRVLRVRGQGGKVVLVPLPPAVARALDRAVDGRDSGPMLRNILGVRTDRHAATRRPKQLAGSAGIRMPRMHPHMLRHTFVTTMLDAGVSLRDVQTLATRLHAEALRLGHESVAYRTHLLVWSGELSRMRCHVQPCGRGGQSSPMSAGILICRSPGADLRR